MPVSEPYRVAMKRLLEKKKAGFALRSEPGLVLRRQAFRGVPCRRRVRGLKGRSGPARSLDATSWGEDASKERGSCKPLMAQK